MAIEKEKENILFDKYRIITTCHGWHFRLRENLHLDLNRLDVE